MRVPWKVWSRNRNCNRLSIAAFYWNECLDGTLCSHAWMDMIEKVLAQRFDVAAIISKSLLNLYYVCRYSIDSLLITTYHDDGSVRIELVYIAYETHQPYF